MTDAYLTFSEWVMKYYHKTLDELTEEEDEELYNKYDSIVNEWVGISATD